MEYGEVLYDNTQRLDRFISNILRMIAYSLVVVVVLSYNNILKIGEIRMTLFLSSIALLLPTLATHFEKKLGNKVKYMIISSCSLVCLITMSYDMENTFILATAPLVFASLYFDKKLGMYTTIVTAVVLVIAQFIDINGISKVALGNFDFMEDFLYKVITKLLQYSFLAIIIMCLDMRCVRLFDKAFLDSSELKRNRDGLDVIVDYTDTLFCARSNHEIATSILLLINKLLDALETTYNQLEGVVGIKENKDIFYGIDENLNSKEFRIINQEMIVCVDGEEYILPIKEAEESNTVFVNKNKLTMFFYSEKELVAFVILHMNLNRTEEVVNKLMHVLYRNIRLAINNIKLSQDMYETQEELVRAFSEISESKSRQTGKHIKRVSEYMKIMADAINLEPKERDSLVIASMMHDIGKLLIPESILEKPGKLTAEEFKIIKTHVHLGYKLLEYSPGRVMEIARVIALQHHEKWDGTGYLGLKGEEIDYYSRIMAVVDVFDALMSKRSYKESWTVEAAYNEIINQSGKHFDPQIIELFKRHFEEFLEVLETYPDCGKSA